MSLKRLLSAVAFGSAATLARTSAAETVTYIKVAAEGDPAPGIDIVVSTPPPVTAPAVMSAMNHRPRIAQDGSVIFRSSITEPPGAIGDPITALNDVAVWANNLVPAGASPDVTVVDLVP